MIVYEKPDTYRGTIEIYPAYHDGHGPLEKMFALPWRLVIHDRHGNIEHIGAVY